VPLGGDWWGLLWAGEPAAEEAEPGAGSTMQAHVRMLHIEMESHNHVGHDTDLEGRTIAAMRGPELITHAYTQT